MVKSGAKFPQCDSGGGLMVIVWQESRRIEGERIEISFSLMVRDRENRWNERRGIVKPVSYVGDEVSLFSLIVDEKGNIFLAISTAGNTVTVYLSEDRGNNFKEVHRFVSEVTIVSPKLFLREDGGLILFVAGESSTSEGGSILSIFYSRTTDEGRWSSLNQLVKELEMRLNFLPYYTSHRGRDYVVFQVLESGVRANYQLYLKMSYDGGVTWSAAKRITDFTEYRAGVETSPDQFDNQRPQIKGINGKLSLVWERRLARENSQIYYAELNLQGELIGEPERVTQGVRSCSFPRLILYRDRVYVLWFDNREGSEHIFIATKDGIFWEDRDLSRIPGISTFGIPIIHQDNLYVVWENRIGNTTRLVFLAPDHSVESPSVIPVNFRIGSRNSNDRYRLRWTSPQDSSGIAGFSYSWDRDKSGSPPERLMVLQDNREIEFSVDEDGWWYFHLAAQDYAGNWSETTTVSFFRDTTPPPPVTIVEPEKDEEGYLLSNTFTISWEPLEGDEIGGYSYSLQYLGSLERDINMERVSLRPPPERIITTSEEASFYNRDNGYWGFTVRAIDVVGNAGEPAGVSFKLNKYVPVTYITHVGSTRDALGRITLEIRGRGFTEGGVIQEVILDREGQKPYDYTFPLELELYTVESDRIIRGPEIEDIEEGTYRVGLIHPERGLYFTKPILKLESSGTVKFGDFRTVEATGLKPIGRRGISLSINTVMLWVIIVFLSLTLLFSIQRVAQLVEESRSLRMEIDLLIRGEDIYIEKRRERIITMKKKGMGLRIKFTLFITILVIAVVLMVSIPLTFYMLDTQRKNLAKGLRNQTEVLLESLVSSARTYLPGKNTLELGLIPNQRTAMKDALYVTITGEGANDPQHFDYIWATDDPDISEKIDGETLQIGLSRIEDELSEEISKLREKINLQARESVTALTEELDRLGARARELALSDEPGAEEELSRYQEEIANLEKVVNQRLSEIAAVVGSVPRFNPEDLDPNTTRYVFYKPIVYRTIGEDRYFRGVVRLGVTTERILNEIEESRRNLLLIIGAIALISIALGVVGALIFASIMIIPINRLLKGVEIIRDTEDKENLKDHIINVKTRDELSTLAETVNQMTTGLVKAAIASKELTVGKEVQKMYIPLEKDTAGNKLTTGKETTENVEFFGYYEGAKGVSGDYFDFKKLDEKHYAIIKCDVAGKGVPAALIMIEVATIFLDYFREWSLKKDGIQLEKLVYRMNDLLEERGFKGRFAALIVVLINIETGTCYLCNAGDNLVHIFDSEKSKMIQKELPEAPAAGVFPSMLVQMQSGFQQVTFKLKKDDCMLLFTDGIEEAKRIFRDENFNHIVCREPGLKEGELHITHPVGSGDEELGITRIYEIVDAVFNRTMFSLFKFHNPIPGEKLTFNFTNCEGTIEEVVLAMVAVEKVFRLYRDPTAGVDNRVMVDRKIDEFLKKHFEQYRVYFNHPIEHGENGQYVYYSHLKEDEQYDDLTILGIRKL